ncbi:TetR/AcrR family transcriptional regulator [Bradyrhizobium erythrophlei]|uniref:Transcriptional regulator, TetR family n=1 Tax=Bradyrhizobium erythrophlei TaxID=1437360 RepID=A0A1M7U1C0_9BRAD|nr:TetR/AcrR family transcriptional regulator [Bradyrhizobium erythrophlei]SHN76775.1 transcriptional regulator, TetR family [Bradyrhizobium erythrophlei]
MNDLREEPARRKSPARATVRLGRPPKEMEGEVEERILDAAHKVFLERGFEGSSIDEIAVAARSGKPTIYARIGDKRALFTAVVMRDVVGRIAQFKSDMSIDGTIEERLVRVAIAMLQWTLESERMALLRLAIAEVNRFPEIASQVSRNAQKLSTEVAVGFLGEMAQTDEIGRLPAFAPERIAVTARAFLDLVVMPMLMRGLAEQKVDVLSEEVTAHVKGRVPFFLAACRHGG